MIRNYIKIYMVCLGLIIFNNICLYTVSTINIYIAISTFTIMCVIGTALYQKKMKIQCDSCYLWLTLIYAIFEIYGIYFLRYGDYNWDYQLFNYLTNICMYICLKKIFAEKKWKYILTKTICISTTVTLVYMIKTEVENQSSIGVRLGDFLSGNVNTVGECLGVLSLVLAFLYITQKEKKVFVLFVVTCGLMLLTGSKMTFFCLMIDLFLFLLLGKRGGLKWIYLGIAACISLYLIFNVPIFYEVMGSRIEDMVFQMFGIGNGKFSNSTSDRMGMIMEGFEIFLEHPLFGGGEKYFAFSSEKYGHYGYSHCNYTEMLCNFGLFGTLIYYIPLLYNTYLIYRYRKVNRSIAYFAIAGMIMRFLLDWMAVTHSDVCINYIPMLISFVAVGVLRRESKDKYVKVENN